MLNIALDKSKYYVDNLSENTKLCAVKRYGKQYLEDGYIDARLLK